MGKELLELSMGLEAQVSSIFYVPPSSLIERVGAWYRCFSWPVKAAPVCPSPLTHNSSIHPLKAASAHACSCSFQIQPSCQISPSVLHTRTPKATPAPAPDNQHMQSTLKAKLLWWPIQGHSLMSGRGSSHA